MAKDNSVYIKDITIATMTNACKNNASRVRSAEAFAGKAWGATVLWLDGKKGFDKYDATKDEKAIAEDIRDTYKNAFKSDWDAAVVAGDKADAFDDSLRGTNARTGEDNMKVMVKGKVKWSSWDETMLSINYCGVIAKVVKAGLASELVISSNKAVGKGDILAKVRETVGDAKDGGKGEGEDEVAGAEGTEVAEVTGVKAFEKAIALMRANIGAVTADEFERIERELYSVVDAGNAAVASATDGTTDDVADMVTG